MNIPFYTQAISSLRPGCAWRLVGDDDDVKNLEWDHRNKQSKPTQDEIIEEAAKLQKEWEDTEYQKQRVPEYPSIGDQLDALFHAGVFPPEMAAQIQAIKDKYPKPE
jgi:phytoene dehydrogenase-like protein